jgi:tRNA(Ile)-lysidine synthase
MTEMNSHTREFIKKVRRTILRHRMIRPGDKVVVGVSGGPDSVCLLHVLHRLADEMGHQLVVAHFVHGWRPAEDPYETDLVRKLAESLGLPFETAQPSSAVQKGASSREEAARDARYEFLDRVREKHRAARIALGHHLNDQAETLLMRLMRGSGGAGLSAIPPVRSQVIIRPLIEINRQEIEFYCREMNLSYAIDSSNLNVDLLRNRVRLELIPLLLRYQPRLVELLGETASSLREESEFLESIAGEWIEREAAAASKGEMTIPLGTLVALPVALRKRVIRRSLSIVRGDIRRIGRKHIQSVDDLASSGRPQGSLNLPDGVAVRKSYGSLHFVDQEKDAVREFCYVMEKPGTICIRELGKSLSLLIREIGECDRPGSPSIAYLDAEKAPFPLAVRNFRPGDRFVPLGMTGHKKIKDFFIDLKVPAETRRTTPILVREEIPLWVAGYRIDDRFKLTSSTRLVLEATLS